MTGLLVLIAAFTYIGAAVFGGSMETKYMKIIEGEAHAAGLLQSHVVNLSKTDEYIAFTVAGAVGGLFVGYLWPSVFERGVP